MVDPRQHNQRPVQNVQRFFFQRGRRGAALPHHTVQAVIPRQTIIHPPPRKLAAVFFRAKEMRVPGRGSEHPDSPSQRLDHDASAFHDAKANLASVKEGHADEGRAFGGECSNRAFSAFPKHCGAVDIQRSRPSVGEGCEAGAEEWKSEAVGDLGREREMPGEARVYDGFDIHSAPAGTHDRERYDRLPTTDDRADYRHGKPPMRAEGSPVSPTGWPYNIASGRRSTIRSEAVRSSSAIS